MQQESPLSPFVLFFVLTLSPYIYIHIYKKTLGLIFTQLSLDLITDSHPDEDYILIYTSLRANVVRNEEMKRVLS